MSKPTKTAALWIVGGDARGLGAGARTYQSTLAMLRGWRHTFQGNAHAVLITANSNFDISPYLETLLWPDHQEYALDQKGDYLRDPVTEKPIFKDPALKALFDAHMSQCLSDPVEYQKIFEKKHRCPWFEYTTQMRRLENADERANAKLVETHIAPLTKP